MILQEALTETAQLATALMDKGIEVNRIIESKKPEIWIPRTNLVQLAQLINRWENAFAPCLRYESSPRITWSGRGDFIAICSNGSEEKWKVYFRNFGQFLANN